MKSPTLSFPSKEATFIRQAYGQARVILEYGSGGSTLLAAEQPGKIIFSVESDRLWAEKMRRHLAERDLPSPVILHHVDIGRTGDWGRPYDDDKWQNYHLYPTQIWDQEYFLHPDLILIDGRLRVACLFTACLRATRPVRVIMDDYIGRARYRKVEEIIQPTQIVGRLGIFDVTPGMLPLDRLTFILSFFNDVMHADPTIKIPGFWEHA